MRSTGALVVRLNQPHSEMALGLKPHVEPSFDPVRQVLPTLAPFPHGHPVQHDDHHADGTVMVALLGLYTPPFDAQRLEISATIAVINVAASASAKTAGAKREFTLLLERLALATEAHDAMQQHQY